MKKFFFFVCYFFLPLIPIFLYLTSIGSPFNSYVLSVILGIFAFIMICNQFLLATKPSFAVKSLGMKGLVLFHSTMPVCIVIVALAHKLLKESNGYSEESFQATFGSVAWWIFAVVIVFTVLFMANTFWLKLDMLKKLKTFVYEKTGLNYKSSRVLHNVTVIAGVVILIHVFLATSSSYTVNFAGIAVMACWMIFSLVLYLVYRLKGRKSLV